MMNPSSYVTKHKKTLKTYVDFGTKMSCPHKFQCIQEYDASRFVSYRFLMLFFFGSQKSFPLTEEEYIYHLDNIADNLRYWGAVSTVRTSLEKTKEKPRIGKVCILYLYMFLLMQSYTDSKCFVSANRQFLKIDIFLFF